MGRSKKYFEKRKTSFFARVKPGPNGCLDWIGYRREKGRGLTSYQGKNIYAPRLSWLLTVGKIPKGKWVLHKCNKQSCVNVRHLYLGNAKNNARDTLKAGRTAVGEKNGSSKMMREEVRSMRRLKKKGWTYARLADMFGYSPNAVGQAIKKETWAHVR